LLNFSKICWARPNLNDNEMKFLNNLRSVREKNKNGKLSDISLFMQLTAMGHAIRKENQKEMSQLNTKSCIIF
jgi:hypothetical protein